MKGRSLCEKVVQYNLLINILGVLVLGHTICSNHDKLNGVCLGMGRGISSDIPTSRRLS